MDAGALPPAVRHFNPRPPRGGRRRQIPPPRQSTDFNPRPPRGGRRQIKKEGSRTAAISIHAPREGGDRSPAHPDGQKRDFNPRPPRGGRRRHICSAMSYSRFQSTPPARGATGLFCTHRPDIKYFNPRPPRGGRLCHLWQTRKMLLISIHAPREGGDVVALVKPSAHCGFQSTPPARGATLFRGRLGQLEDNFNPRPPRGGRRLYCGGHPVRPVISIHAPREGGDARGGYTNIWMHISIHAPREGGDANFIGGVVDEAQISIHAPREGGDDPEMALPCTQSISIHAPREGGDVTTILNSGIPVISIHAPREGGDHRVPPKHHHHG